MRPTAIGFAAGSIITCVVFLVVFDLSPRSTPPAVTPEFAPTEVSFENRLEPEPASADSAADTSESEAPSLSRDADSSEFYEPIRTPAEFDFVSEDQPYWHHDTWRSWHARLEREARNRDWSLSAEAELTSALAENPEIGRYGTPIVNCRTRTCQVQMLAFGANDVDVGEWSSHFGSVYRTLGADFALGDFSVAREGGITTIVLHIYKMELPPTASAR
jgi:hypothetical protein